MCPVRLEREVPKLKVPGHVVEAFSGLQTQKKLNRMLWTLKVFHESTLEELLMFTAIQEVDRCR